ncbi:DNA-dependent protein kinase catalytic subunit-like [Protobothrops mucrosquamatus]|uniref:DNA-dependent protein kinase catalytic subunit-like n=1 Tax=Protobothrops mucrosquamatus TaxID=103944 RepID=UPI000775B4A9|nr:DNA-dependent protein kinase catalytic subunit-like [Protobothrops mucrosquamatus]
MAPSLAAPGGGLQGFLFQLHDALRSSDPGNAALRGCGLIRSLAESCLISSGDDILALQISLVFSKENGLLSFIHKSLSVEDFRECREEALKFILAFVEKIGLKVQPYAQDVKRICVTVYTKGRSAKCGIPALELLIKLLQNLQSSYIMEDMKVGEIFNKFYGELAIKSKVPDTVLERIYELLGVLGEVQPSEMIDNSEKLFRAYLGELKIQMTSATRQPKFTIVAGCLKGLTALMYNFTKSMDEDPRTSKEIFDFTVKAISPQIDLKRYAVPLAGLHLFSKHAVQFSTYLLDNYVSLFQTMSKWSGHQNAELKKAGHSALDSFLKQISSMVAKDVEMHKSKLQFFMEQFYAIIRNMDASNKELSIAIRGYGLFAAPCKVIRPKDVDFMYVELLQRCKQMYLTEAETIDDHVYQLPSFLQSIASVIFHLDAIPEIYTPVLERLIIVQIDSFPQYSTKMQTVCCRSIVKVFLALAAKGPVLWSFMSTVVHQGLIRICSKPLVFSMDGIVDPVDSALRDFCGQCVHEFLKWSIKQTTPQQQEKSPVNTKSLFKRLYSLALHPNAFKRLGAALAFNNIYREFREENALVDQFVFEALVVYLESLALTHGDEKTITPQLPLINVIGVLENLIQLLSINI